MKWDNRCKLNHRYYPKNNGYYEHLSSERNNQYVRPYIKYHRKERITERKDKPHSEIIGRIRNEVNKRKAEKQKNRMESYNRLIWNRHGVISNIANQHKYPCTN